MDFDGEAEAVGAWDIRGLFNEYIGNYPIAGKSVLDVGTASGFLAFEAERAGAASVTALEIRSVSEFQRIPFLSTSFHRDRKRWAAEVAPGYERMKRGFWYAHHKYNSRVEMIYESLSSIPEWNRKFDVVMAGAILEHFSDPVSMIGNLAMVANEAIIIAFTLVDDTDEMRMVAANDWTRPEFDYTFWTLSRGLFRRVFDNLGFDVEMPVSRAWTGGNLHSKPTIIARRRASAETTGMVPGSGA